MSRIVSRRSGSRGGRVRRLGGLVRRDERSRSPATSSATRASAARSGGPSTACPTAARCKKTLGPAWTARGRPPAGYFTKRTAEAWLRRTLAEAAAGTLPGHRSAPARPSPTPAPSTSATSSTTASASRRRCATTTRSSATTSCRTSATIALEDLTPERVEHWAAHEIDPDRRLANRTREKTITVFHGVMERARKLYRLPANPVADVEKPRTAATHRDRRLLARGGRWRSSEPPTPSRTPRSSSPPRSPASARASSSPSAGATSTSPARRSASERATPTAT